MHRSACRRASSSYGPFVCVLQNQRWPCQNESPLPCSWNNSTTILCRPCVSQVHGRNRCFTANLLDAPSVACVTKDHGDGHTQVCERLPLVEVTWQAPKLAGSQERAAETSSASTSAASPAQRYVLEVHLRRIPGPRGGGTGTRAYTPRFPKVPPASRSCCLQCASQQTARWPCHVRRCYFQLRCSMAAACEWMDQKSWSQSRVQSAAGVGTLWHQGSIPC